MQQMTRVTCAVVFHKGKVLVTQRGPEMNQPYKWEFPGGKTEPGETDEDCILRELTEELSISVKLYGKLRECRHDYGTIEIVLVPFLAEFESGTITLKEHMNYMWLWPDELASLDWAPADLGVVDQVMALPAR